MEAPAVLAGAPGDPKAWKTQPANLWDRMPWIRGTSQKGSSFFFLHSKRLRNTEWTFERETG